MLADLKTFSTKVAELGARFKFTDQAVSAFQNDRVPEAVLTKLNSLKNKDFSRDDFVAELTKVLNADELKQFQTPIMNSSELPGAAKDKGPVQKYIAEFAAARGWQHGVSEKLRSEWTLEDDPGVAPLRAVLTKSPHGNQPIQFGKKFFWTEEMRGPRAPVSGTYKPEYYPNAPSSFESPEAKTEPKFLVWRTEETRAKPPESFLAAKELVRAAWKRIKARELAKNRADAIANAVRASAGDVPELIGQNVRELTNTLRNEITDPKVKDRVQAFSINGVCPLTGERTGLQPFQLRATSDIPYPNYRVMTETLLDERTKPPKTTFVMTDLPKDTYYVATLKSRDVKKVGDFQMVYSDLSFLGGSSPMTQTHQMVIGSFMADAEKKNRESIMGLIKQEFRYEVTDEQKKKLEENEKRGGDE
jgi:hypothetical protein